MLTEAYTVRLDSFSGPLDLLLHLIRRAEIDISDISIASITDRYLEFIGRADHIDVDLAGEFLVAAATLIEIKSRLLAPVEVGTGASAFEHAERGATTGDPAEQLIQQLLAYRVYRDAAATLGRRREAWQQRRPLRPVAVASGAGEALPSAAEDRLELEDLSLYELMGAYERVVASVEFERIGDHTIAQDDTPIELHAADVMDRLTRFHTPPGSAPTMPLRAIFADRDRADVIGLFLAILELVRQGAVSVLPQGREVMVRLLAPTDARDGPERVRPVRWDDDDIVDGDADEDDADDELP